MERKHLFIAAVAAACIVIASPSAAQKIRTVKPESAGMSTERLGRIDTVMREFIDRKRISGMVTAVARNGGIVHFKAHGMADIEAGRPLTPDALFRIASMSKPVTAVAALILYEEGRFLLSDPVSRYIPELSGMTVVVPASGEGYDSPHYAVVPAKKDILVRHLFMHTAGFTYGTGQVGRLYRSAGVQDGLKPATGTIGDMVKLLAKQPLLAEPGEQWEYGLESDVLGYLVEVVSGQPLDVFMRERIFAPLGMNDTGFSVPDSDRTRLVPVYSRTREGGIEKRPDGSYIGGPTGFFSGGAGLITSAGDYLRFAMMLLNGGELDGVRILGPKTVELMSAVDDSFPYIWEGRDGVRSTHGDRYALGVGVRTETDDLTPNGAYGWGGAFHTHFWIDPEENIVGVFMSQLGGSDIRRHQRIFKELVYQAVIK